MSGPDRRQFGPWRSWIGQGLDTRESVGIRVVEAQAEKAMANIKMLLEEADGTLSDIVNMTVSLGEPLYREPVYRIVGKLLSGIFPIPTGLVGSALARPEWLVEIDATAVLSKPAPLNN